MLTKTPIFSLITSKDDDGRVLKRIDGAHAMHTDGKGHSCLFVTMRLGSMIDVSKKMGFVNTSSIESEIVASGERIPKCGWFRHLRLAQGDDRKDAMLLQDNKSDVLLQNSFLFSAGKGSKHINDRCYFVVDKMEKKEVTIVCCLTEKMVADHSSKRTQGRLFVKQRNTIQRIELNDLRCTNRGMKEY